jgi:hypothetical protein
MMKDVKRILKIVFGQMINIVLAVVINLGHLYRNKPV